MREKLKAVVDHRYFIPVCMTAGILLRLAWILAVNAKQVSDFEWYYERALEIAGGQGYAVNGHLTAYWPAGYPLFLGALFRLFGPIQFLAKLANIAFFCATMWMAYLFARKAFQSETAGRVALGLLAFYPNEIAYTSLLSTEIVFQFLILLGAVLFIYAEQRTGWFVSAGLAWGLAVMTKPQAVFVPMLFLLVYLWRRKGLMLRAGVLIYATMLLAVTPWIVRNYRIFGKPLLSTNGGIVLLIGNNPYATGNHIWDENVRSLIGEYGQNEDQIFGAKELARDQRAREVAISFIRHHPGEDLLLWPKKFAATYKSDVDGFYYSLGMVEDRGRIANSAYFGLRVIGELYYIAILILFLWSIPAIVRSKIPGYRVGLYVAGYFTLIYLVYAGNARYHFAQMPWIILCVGLQVAQMLHKEARAATAESQRELPLSSAATA